LGKQVLTLLVKDFPVDHVAYSPDGKTIATYDNDVKLWDAKTGDLKQTLTEHAADIYDVQFSPKGDLLASASTDKTIKLWDPQTGKVIRTLEGHTDIVRSVAFAPDQKTLASASVDAGAQRAHGGRRQRTPGVHRF
jgi:WD40 repeat protein